MNDLVSIKKFRNEVASYDTETLLQMCSHLSRRLDDLRKTVFTAQIPRRIGRYIYQQDIAVTHHGIAMVAMLALRQHRFSKGNPPELFDVIRLINNSDHIEDPHFKDTDIFMILVKTAHRQWPFQENPYYFVPRHLLLYGETKVDLPIDPVDTFNKNNGLSVTDFMVIGLLMYAAGLTHHTFSSSFLENTKEARIKPYVTTEKLKAFLSIAGASFEEFRQLCLFEEKENPDAGPYQFNPLLKRPVITRKDRQLCLPLPRLSVHRVTKGLYYDLLDEFSEPEGNPFADWFGYAFQEYGGLLLRDCFGEKNVFPEPRYGSPEKRGPDWIVIRNGRALFLEFRSGRLNKRAKTYADYQEIVNLLKRNVVDTIRKLPQKIEDLLAGKTGIPSLSDISYLSAVVTYEPLYPEEYMVQLIKQELVESQTPDIDFELMSIEDLEWLLAWAPYGDPLELLHKKRSDSATKDKNLRSFVQERAQESDITDLKNPLLERTWSKYLGKLWLDLAKDES